MDNQENQENQELQKLEIPEHVQCTLYKQEGKENWSYVEAPRLLKPFKVGARCDVGSIFTRTFGNDYRSTSPVASIDEKKYDKDKNISLVYFTTRNNRYLLEVNGDIDKIIEHGRDKV